MFLKTDLTRIEKFLEYLIDTITGYSVKIASALLILVVGILIIRLLRNIIKKIGERRNIDPTVSGFLLNMLSWLLKVLLFVAIISKLGIETSSFVAVLGAIGLAISLSLQGSLSNFTGGLLIIMFKPFRVGDYIQAQGFSGTVKSIQIFNTQINNDNNQAIFIPNGILSNGSIMNYSKEANRRSDLKITVSASNDLAQVQKLFEAVLHDNDKVLKDPKPVVFLSEMNGDTAVFSVRPWAKNSMFFAMQTEVLLNLRNVINTQKITTPSQTIQLISNS